MSDIKQWLQLLSEESAPPGYEQYKKEMAELQHWKHHHPDRQTQFGKVEAEYGKRLHALIDKYPGCWNYDASKTQNRLAQSEPEGRYRHVNETDESSVKEHKTSAEIMAEWQNFITEYGMTTGGLTAPAGGTGQPKPGALTPDPKAQAQQKTTIQNNLNKLKSAGINIPSQSTAAANIEKSQSNPTAQPSQSQKTTAQGFGDTIEKLVTTGTPTEVDQFKNIIQKMAKGQ